MQSSRFSLDINYKTDIHFTNKWPIVFELAKVIKLKGSFLDERKLNDENNVYPGLYSKLKHKLLLLFGSGARNQDMIKKTREI